MLKKEKEEIFEVQFYIVKKFSKFDFTSSRNSNLSHHWVIAGNFQNSILYRQEIFEISFHLIIVLEERKKFSKFKFILSLSWKFSKFDFTSSRNFRNSVSSRHCTGKKEEIFEIQIYLIIELQIFEIRFYVIKKFQFISSLSYS